MTDTDTRESSPENSSIDVALQAVLTARGRAVAAKRTRSHELVARAELDLQAAVDDARALGVKWGRIGSTLGIARGNAYQRYRKPLSRKTFPSQGNTTAKQAYVQAR